MRTISYQWPGEKTGDAAASCDVCGVTWRRSQMKRKRDGLLYCPDCKDEVDKRTIAEDAAARSARIRNDDRDVARLETIDGSSLNSVHYTNAGTTDDATEQQTVAGDSYVR